MCVVLYCCRARQTQARAAGALVTSQGSPRAARARQGRREAGRQRAGRFVFTRYASDRPSLSSDFECNSNNSYFKRTLPLHNNIRIFIASTMLCYCGRFIVISTLFVRNWEIVYGYVFDIWILIRTVAHEYLHTRIGLPMIIPKIYNHVYNNFVSRQRRYRRYRLQQCQGDIKYAQAHIILSLLLDVKSYES